MGKYCTTCGRLEGHWKRCPEDMTTPCAPIWHGGSGSIHSVRPAGKKAGWSWYENGEHWFSELGSGIKERVFPYAPADDQELEDWQLTQQEFEHAQEFERNRFKEFLKKLKR